MSARIVFRLTQPSIIFWAPRYLNKVGIRWLTCSKSHEIFFFKELGKVGLGYFFYILCSLCSDSFCMKFNGKLPRSTYTLIACGFSKGQRSQDSEFREIISDVNIFTVSLDVSFYHGAAGAALFFQISWSSFKTSKKFLFECKMCFWLVSRRNSGPTLQVRFVGLHDSYYMIHFAWLPRRFFLLSVKKLDLQFV